MLRVAVLLLFLCVAASAQSIQLVDAISQGRVKVAASGNGRESISLHIINATAEPTAVAIPAGSIFAADNGERQVVLRELEAKLDAAGEVDAILPSAALSSANTGNQRPLKLVAETEPRIAPLLPLFAKQNDLPRPTAQLAVFVVMEDLTWESWTKWLAATRAPGKEKQPVTPAEVAQAVDGLAFVKLSNPAKPPALLADEALKRLALRNPWARGKAMALYGMTVDNALTGDPALPPDLNQLLHTAPNDNCPICRQRQKVPEFP